MQTIFQDQQRRGILRAGTTFDQFVDTYRRMEARGQPVPDLTPTAPRVTIATPSDWIAAGPSGQVNRNWFDRHIGAKGISDDEFVEKYLGGWWSPRTRLSVGSDGGHISTSLTIKPGMHIFDRNGHIIPEGHDIGTMTRDFNPENRSFYNNYFSLSNHVRGGGIAKWMLKNQYDIYRQMGINHGEVFAALDWGGYVWSKFGFIPERADWRHVQIQATSRLRDLLQDGQIDAATNSAVQRLLLARDPMTLWQISDLTMPVLSRSGERSTLGKELLKGQYWHGTFDLNSNLQMDRFDAYTRDAKSPFTPPSP